MSATRGGEDGRGGGRRGRGERRSVTMGVMSKERESEGGGGARSAGGARPVLELAALEALKAPKWFEEEAGALGVEFESGDVERLGRYLALLLTVNERMNLTAVRDVEEAWRRHILDSLTLLPLLAELPEGSRIADIGSGGGLPGLVLATVLPRQRFTLVEATGKKAEFLREASRVLGLQNVEVVNARAETAGHDRGTRVSEAGRVRREGGLREAFDVVVARAVGRLSTLAELVVPFVKVGGRALLIKGAKAEDELEEARGALRQLKVVCAGVVATPTGRIVVLEKQTATPRDFPRRSGEPKRSPLR